MRWFWISALSLAAMLGASSVLHAQGAGARSIWDGLYTPAQADRGRDVYASQCAR
jgi:hypothetical protein